MRDADLVNHGAITLDRAPDLLIVEGGFELEGKSRARRITSGMKPNGHKEPDDPALDRLLREWKVTAPLPRRFQESVWQRIALTEATRPAESGWADIFGRIQTFLARPSLAAGYVAILLGLGFAFGWTRGLEKSAQLDQALGAQYVRVIDPYQSLIQH